MALGGVRFVFNLPRPEPELRDDGVAVFDSNALNRIRLQGIESGNIDAFHSLSDPENTHEFTRAPADAVSSPLKLVSVFLALNSGAPPYDNSELRRLLAAASPTDFIAAVIGDPVATGVAPLDFLSDADSRMPAAFSRPEALSKLDIRAAHGIGELNIAYDQESSISEAEWRAMWQAFDSWLGVSVRLSPTSSEGYLRMRNPGALGALPVAIESRYPDPVHMLQAFVDAYGDSGRPVELVELQHYVGQAAREPDPVRRMARVSSAVGLIAASALVVPARWDFGRRYIVRSERFVGYRPPLFHASRFREVRPATAG